MRRSYSAARGGVGIWSAVAILCVLLSFSAYLVTTRIGNLLPGESDVISIKHDRPSMNVGAEDEDPWQTGSQIGIFDSLYENAEGEIVVESDDGDALIAPGASHYYRFYIKNDGNAALDFSLRVLPSFHVAGDENEEIPLPISLRISDHDGRYLLGGKNEWVSVASLPELAKGEDSYVKLQNTVGIQSYYVYLLEWRWDYESGDDAFDTLLGTSAIESELSLSLEIATTATENPDPYAVGGKADGDVSGIDWEIKQYGQVAFVALGIAAVGSIAMVVYHLSHLDDLFSRKRKYR